MEDVLSQYALPYDPLCPLICFDERPCFLIEDIGSILPMSPSKAKRYHYEYGKNGSYCVFLAFDPHRKMRYVEVRERRTAVDYAQFMHHLVKRYYPQVERYALFRTISTRIRRGPFMRCSLPMKPLSWATVSLGIIRRRKAVG